MANTTETATFNVKSNIGEVGKDASNAAAEFKIMGVSLNGVKAGFASAAVTAKGMFGSIKAGLISTGIGAFVVLIGSLVSFFANTKRGADLLSQGFTAMGAVVDVLTDRLSKVGEAISFVFSGEFRKAGDALAGTFAGITEEINKEVAAMVNLKKRTQELRDADNKFMVQKAATRQEIERARLIAEDESKTAAERLNNLKKALELEAETTKQEIELARERVAIQKEEMALSENLVEDEEKLAQLKVALIETETASIKMRRRVVTEVNALENEILAEEKARATERQEIIDAEFDAKMVANDEWNKEQQRIREEDLAAQKAAADESVMVEEAAAKAKDKIRNAQLNNISKGINLIKGLAGDNKAIQAGMIVAENALGIARTIISTQASNAAVIAEGAALAIPSGGASVIAASKLVVGNNLAAGISIAASAAATAQGLSALGQGGGGGGANAPSGGAGGSGGEGIPAPQMMSGSFDISGGVAPEPVKAFVLTDEMSNSQNQLANIRRRATI